MSGDPVMDGTGNHLLAWLASDEFLTYRPPPLSPAAEAALDRLWQHTIGIAAYHEVPINQMFSPAALDAARRLHAHEDMCCPMT